MRNTAAQESFRTFLREDLVARCKHNPRYSLRSYARTLGVQSSFLSKIINGKRSITAKTVERFSGPLGLSPHERLKFTNAQSVAMDHLVPLSQDVFQAVAEWYHFAILELFTVKGFTPTSAYISKRLGISRITVIDALTRLHRLGWIEKDKLGKYVLRQGENTTTGIPHTTAALRKVQKQMLEMAIEALDSTPIEERDQSTMSMAVDSQLLPEAKEKIKKFRRELCGFLQTKRTTNSVYHLTISLYPVARAERQTRKDK